MQRMFAVIVVGGLLSGLVGAFAYDQLGSDAGAAPPLPSATQVREQNLDGSGLIRVHEQGTANVAGTVNVGNLPAVRDVNVVSQPPPQVGRLIDATPMTPIGGGFYASPLVSVADCRTVSVLVQGGVATNSVNISPDGTTRIAAMLSGTISREDVGGVPASSSILNAPLAAPFLSIRADTAASQPAPSAWIWCEP